MSPLLGPILAQLVTLGVSDRTEVRHIAASDSYSEATTSPRVGLDLGWKHSNLTLAYGPILTLTGLEEKDPTLLVFHTATLNASYRLQRTTLTLSEAGGLGVVNFRSQALGDPGFAPVTTAPAQTSGGTTPPPTTTGGVPGMPTTTATGATNPRLAFNQNLSFVSSVTTLRLDQLVSSNFTVGGGVAYFYNGALGDQADLYPVTHGPGALLSGTYRVTRDDSATTYLVAQLAQSSGGNRAWLLTANEAWTHRFNIRTSASLGSGLSMTRNSTPQGLIYYSIYPNFLATLTSAARLGRSLLTTSVGVISAPYIDPVRALADPRLSANASVTLSKNRFSSSLTGNTGLALTSGGDRSVLSSVNGSFNVSYRLADALSVDSGIRSAWQSYEGSTTIPISIAVYAGFTVGLVMPLNGRK